jgi:hypothetical protein
MADNTIILVYGIAIESIYKNATLMNQLLLTPSTATNCF